MFIDHKSIAKNPGTALILYLRRREVYVSVYKLNTQNTLSIFVFKFDLIIKLNLLGYKVSLWAWSL